MFIIAIVRHPAFLASLLLLPGSARAGGQILPFRNYSVKDGLPSNQVWKIHQDSRGYIWIGTNNGISVYDGVAFTNYTVANGLPNPTVSHIVDDPERPGAVYILTVKGDLVRYDGGDFAPIRVGNAPGGGPDCIIAADSGGVWGTIRDSLFRIQDDSLVLVAPPVAFKNKYYSHRMRSSEGGLWVSDGDELHFFKLAGNDVAGPTISLQFRSIVTELSAGTGGRLFVSLLDSTIHEVRKGKITNHRKLPSDSYHVVTDDGRGTLWITSNAGLLALSREGFGTAPLRTISIGNGLPDGQITQAFIDHEENLWIGTWTAGIARLASRGIVRITLEGVNEGARNPSAQFDSSVWVRATHGLWEVSMGGDSGASKVYHALPFQPGACTVDPQGSIWISCGNNRSPMFCRYAIRRNSGRSSLSRQQTLGPFSDLKGGQVDMMFVDRQHRLWCGLNRQGVSVYDLASLRRVMTYRFPDGVPDSSIRAIYQDRKDRIWLGGFTGGLAVIEGTTPLPPKARAFTVKDGLPGNEIRSIFEDKAGRIWVGTRFDGVAVYRENRVEVISQRNGLRSNAVWSICEDDQGRIWLGTEVGLECVDASMLKPLSPTNELVSGRVYASGIAAGRYLWFISDDEIVIDDYRGNRPKPSPPPVHVRRFQAGGTDRPFDSPQTLSYDQNLCVFDYVGLCYRNPGAVLYQTMLEGLDHEWLPPMSQRSISYAALQPGTYTFRVRSINSDGLMSVQPASVTFTIAPPFWERWWFRSAIALLFFGAGPFLYFRRVSRLKREQAAQSEYTQQLMGLQESERTRISHELHDSLGQILILIKTLSLKGADLCGAGDPARRDFEEISELSAEGIREARAISYDLRPYQIDSLGLSQSIQSLVAKASQTAQIQYRSEIDNIDGSVAKENEIHCYRIVQECLNNILKHSAATEAHVIVRKEAARIVLSISDNGRGLPSSSPAKQKIGGFGFRSLNERAKLLHASLAIVSSPREGTAITITVPVITPKSGIHQ